MVPRKQRLIARSAELVKRNSAMAAGATLVRVPMPKVIRNSFFCLYTRCFDNCRLSYVVSGLCRIMSFDATTQRGSEFNEGSRSG